MIIIGHEMIRYEEFSQVFDIKDIESTANLVWFENLGDKGLEIARFCQDNEVEYALKIDNLTDLMLYGALGAKYVMIEGDGVEYQRVANEYLLDTKILVLIDEVSQIEKIARLGIDGVIFKRVLAGF